MATFLVGTCVQYYFFSGLPDRLHNACSSGLPEVPPAKSLQRENVSSVSLDTTDAASPPQQPTNEGEEAPPPPTWEAIRSIPADLAASLKVIWDNPPILFRLVFLGLEIAFEDASIVVIAAQMGITLPWLGNKDAVAGNIWASIGVACGKMGGVVASILMIRYYHPPENPSKYFPIFVLILISCLVIWIFPVVTDLERKGFISANVARAIFLIGFFTYFFMSTLPKLGLMSLLQSMVTQVENGPRVFGFIAIIATSFDALVIMLLSILFVNYTILNALWITAGVYTAHGVLELIFGPLLILGPMKRTRDGEVHREDHANKETSSLVPPRPDEVVGGTYTQRSASILIGEPKNLVSPRLPHPTRSVAVSFQAAAVLGSSAHIPISGSVNRRVSLLAGATPSGTGGVLENYTRAHSPRTFGGASLPRRF
jgi:hypothetical protein